MTSSAGSTSKRAVLHVWAVDTWRPHSGERGNRLDGRPPHTRLGTVDAGLEEAQVTDEADPLWIGELSPPPERVLDHLAPQGDRPDRAG